MKRTELLAVGIGVLASDAVDGSGLSLIGNDPGGARMGKLYIEA